MSATASSVSQTLNLPPLSCNQVNKVEIRAVGTSEIWWTEWKLIDFEAWQVFFFFSVWSKIKKTNITQDPSGLDWNRVVGKKRFWTPHDITLLHWESVASIQVQFDWMQTFSFGLLAIKESTWFICEPLIWVNHLWNTVTQTHTHTITHRRRDKSIHKKNWVTF